MKESQPLYEQKSGGSLSQLQWIVNVRSFDQTPAELNAGIASQCQALLVVSILLQLIHMKETSENKLSVEKMCRQKPPG